MKRSGFTLVEVVVALGIAAGALVLLISANHHAMRRSLRAHERVRLEEAVEGKAAEIRLGVETRSSGEFVTLQGWTWSISREKFRLDGLKLLDEITFKVQRPEGPAEPARTVTILQFAPEALKK